MNTDWLNEIVEKWTLQITEAELPNKGITVLGGWFSWWTWLPPAKEMQEHTESTLTACAF